jgi:hypothetical protein
MKDLPVTFDQSRGSFIVFGSGPSISSQSGSGSIPEPGFDDQKMREKYRYRFDENLQFTYVQATALKREPAALQKNKFF